MKNLHKFRIKHYSIALICITLFVNCCKAQICSFVGLGGIVPIQAPDNAPEDAVVFSGTICRSSGNGCDAVSSIEWGKLKYPFENILAFTRIENPDGDTVEIRPIQPEFGKVLDYEGVQNITDTQGIRITYTDSSFEFCTLIVNFQDTNNQPPIFIPDEGSPFKFTIKSSWDTSVAINWRVEDQIRIFDYDDTKSRMIIETSNSDVIVGNVQETTDLGHYPFTYIYDLEIFLVNPEPGTNTYTLTAFDEENRTPIEVEVTIEPDSPPPTFQKSHYFISMADMPNENDPVDADLVANTGVDGEEVQLRFVDFQNPDFPNPQDSIVKIGDDLKSIVFAKELEIGAEELGRNNMVIFLVEAFVVGDETRSAVTTVVVTFPPPIPNPVTTPEPCPPSDCTSTISTECPTVTDSTATTPTECDCPTCPPSDCTSTISTECPTVTDSTATTPTECDCSTCPPQDSTTAATECPTVTDSTATPPECDCSTTTATDCPPVTADPGCPTCPPSDCTTTITECPTTTPDPDCPVCPPPTTCPTTTVDPTCPECPTDPTCPTTVDPNCPTTTVDPNCPTPKPCDCEDKEDDDECATGGLIAATVTTSVLAAASLAFGGYLIYVLRKASINPFSFSNAASPPPTTPKGLEANMTSSNGFNSPPTPPPSFVPTPPPSVSASPSKPLLKRFSFGETTAPYSVSEPGIANPTFQADEMPQQQSSFSPSSSSSKPLNNSVATPTSPVEPVQSPTTPYVKSIMASPKEIEPDYEEFPENKSRKISETSEPRSRKVSRVKFAPDTESKVESHEYEKIGGAGEELSKGDGGGSEEEPAADESESEYERL